MYYYWLIFLKTLEVFELIITDWIQFWYFSAPGLAWDATLKITKIQLELLSDPDMLLMSESGIRGGIGTISHRHAKVN